MEEDNRRYLWARAAQILSEEELTALWLHYGENLSMRDIAAVLGRSCVAVKTMLFRAQKAGAAAGGVGAGRHRCPTGVERQYV